MPARFGVDGGIRSTLASEDLEWRRDNNGRILERLFNVNVYFKAYASSGWTSRPNWRAGAPWACATRLPRPARTAKSNNARCPRLDCRRAAPQLSPKT